MVHFSLAQWVFQSDELKIRPRKNDIPGHGSSFKPCLENIFFLCIPVARFHPVFSKPSCSVFYYGGKLAEGKSRKPSGRCFSMPQDSCVSAIQDIVSGSTQEGYEDAGQGCVCCIRSQP